MIITISGLPGSGKDTVGKILAGKLGYRFYSTGDILGKLAQDKGLSIEQLMKAAESDPSIDRDIDAYSEKLGREEDDFVISSHLAARFIPHAFKVFLSVDPEEGARRVFQDSPNRPDEPYTSVEEAREALSRILESNRKRYRELYGFDPYEGKGYDQVIDTSEITAEQVADKILDRLQVAK